MDVTRNNRKLVFVGGPHSVGKSTFLRALSETAERSHFKINIISMSHALEEAAQQKYSKSIGDINKDAEQVGRLTFEFIHSLRGKEQCTTILDGHYVMINEHGAIIGRSHNESARYEVRFDALVVATAAPEVIHARRVEKREGRWPLVLDLVKKELKYELDAAREVSTKTGTPLYIIENVDVGKTVERLWKLLLSLDGTVALGDRI